MVPSFQTSFSDALLTSSSAVLISTESMYGQPPLCVFMALDFYAALNFLDKGGKPGGSKAAKKGRKKIVLFSTAGGSHRV